MYSDHPSVNILTALLVNHGVSHVVVCPGSRNAPIVHNLEQCPHIQCYGVTDERSAGFYALGLAQATGKAAAVCVTSGSALLGVLPAVVEAALQHVPVVVISADRPGAWIGQLDGQTLPQPDALRGWVRCAVSLPERDDEEGHWHTNRLINEALTALWRGGCGPVHINVPLSEPLFGFNTPQLPHERIVDCLSARQAAPDLTPLAERWRQARRRMVVVGQMPPHRLEPDVMRRIGQEAVIVHEALSGVEGGVAHPDEVVARLSTVPEARPDLIVYLGGTLVSKPLKRYLRTLNDSEQWRVETDGSMPDTFGHLTALIEGAPAVVLRRMAEEFCCDSGNDSDEQARFSHLWQTTEKQVAAQLNNQTLPYSQAAVVQYLEQQLGSGTGWQTHYANSSAVRLGIRYARHHIWCNRGVNGIEGSISTAAGFSLASPDKVLCVTGDLSFFYDQNALWPELLDGRLRLLLLNNGCGGIFSRLPGLEASPAASTVISGAHHATAQGICAQWGIGYQQAHDMTSAKQGIDALLSDGQERPMLLEVFTTTQQDNAALQLG